MKNKKIFIGCSSSELVNDEYMNLAIDVSLKISQLGYDFVFGAASF